MISFACRRIGLISSELQIPVFRGCEKPLLAKKRSAADYHGADGLGEVPDLNAPSLELLQKKNAVNAMIKIAKENSGEVKKDTLVEIDAHFEKSEFLKRLITTLL